MWTLILSKPNFGHGQLHAALPRERNHENVKVYIYIYRVSRKSLPAHQTVMKNAVIKDLLNNSVKYNLFHKMCLTFLQPIM